jgi:hypothetical protein
LILLWLRKRRLRTGPRDERLTERPSAIRGLIFETGRLGLEFELPSIVANDAHCLLESRLIDLRQSFSQRRNDTVGLRGRPPLRNCAAEPFLEPAAEGALTGESK